jgi:hypothetical protein
MSSPTSSSVRETPAFSQSGLNELMRLWRQGPAPTRAQLVQIAALIVLTLLLYLAAGAVGVLLFVRPHQTPVTAAAEGPWPLFAQNAPLWDRWHRLIIQENGRLKPFASFCRESVQAITGEDGFEGANATATVVSWMLLHDADPAQARHLARELSCDWESHPFILCDYQPLRTLLYRSLGAAPPGRHVAPALLRDSVPLTELLWSATQKGEQEKKALFTPLEQKARELKRRLALYDRIRAGGGHGLRERIHPAGDFGLVALGSEPRIWFSLRSVKELAARPSAWEESVRAGAGEAPEYPSTEIQEVVDTCRSLTTAYRSGDETWFASSSRAFLATVGRISGQDLAAARIDRELWWHEQAPCRKAWVALLVASGLLAVGAGVGRRLPSLRWLLLAGGWFCYLGGLGWGLLGAYCRLSLAEQLVPARVLEALLVPALLVLLGCLTLELWSWRGRFLLMGALLAIPCLLLVDPLPVTRSAAGTLLDAVLLERCGELAHGVLLGGGWLALVLAWGVGALCLGIILLVPAWHGRLRHPLRFFKRTLRIAVVMLLAGLVLGMVWSDLVQGWAWNGQPTEAWSAGALVAGLGVLRARRLGWLDGFGQVFGFVVSFSLIVLCWWGLGIGADQEPWLCATCLLALALTCHSALRYWTCVPEAA